VEPKGVENSDIEQRFEKGKSGAFRVIYAWTSGERILYPLFVYFKREKEDITKAEIEALLKKLFFELEQPD
jgi:mRNA-degrading endonuclease RelE of RelBE toxin-antitoxin system